MTLLRIPVIFGLSIEVYIILLIIAFPTFFIWRRLLRKFIKNPPSLRIWIWISTIVATPIIYVVLILLFFYSINYYPKHNFDKKAWFTNKEERYGYSDDIIDSKMLIGKTKSEVREILGDDGNLNDNDDWYFDLGFRPEFFNIDPDSLEILFKEGKVVDVIQHKR